MEETIASLSSQASNKRPHVSSASSTPSKPGTKKQANDADLMDGIDATAIVPVPPHVTPQQQGTPDKRTLMENDD